MLEPRAVPPDALALHRETIGRTTQGRPLRVRIVGEPQAALRILVIAGQHGDERLAGAAVKTWTRRLRTEGHLPRDVQVACLRDANPDGRAARRRTNAAELDLNRDHQRLAAEETRALHAFARRWQPQLIVDVHTYPARRKHLLARGLVHCHDVYIDGPTHPQLVAGPTGQIAAALREALEASLGAAGYRAARYTLVTKTGRVRHSTPDVVDARNGLALNPGAVTLLIEGRQPTRGEGAAARQRVRAALQTTLDHALHWAHGGREMFLIDRGAASNVLLRGRYEPASESCVLPFYDLALGAVRTIELPDLYTPDVTPTHAIKLPRAYAVPRALTSLLEVLARHGEFGHSAVPGSLHNIEQYRVTELVPSRRPRRAPQDLALQVTRQTCALDGYQFFPVTAANGPALAILLEPASKYGLLRERELGLTLALGQDYPILRVLK